MPVDTQRPYAKDYGMAACEALQRLGVSVTLWEPLMALAAGAPVAVAKSRGVSTGGFHPPTSTTTTATATLTQGKVFRSVTAYVESLCLSL